MQVETFPTVHPDRPDAVVMCDENTFAEFSTLGYVRTDKVADVAEVVEAPKRVKKSEKAES
jgi:hypothetical protein